MSDSLAENEKPVFSEEFYRQYADRYAEVAHQLLQSIYIKSSHPALRGDLDLLERLKELASGSQGFCSTTRC